MPITAHKPLLSIIFIGGIFCTIFAVGLFTYGIHIWILASAIQQDTTLSESILADQIQERIQSDFTQSYLLLRSQAMSGTTNDILDSTYFDVGVVENKNGVTTENINNTTMEKSDLLSFASAVTINTPRVVIDPISHVVYITYVQSSQTYAVGGVKLTGNIFSTLIQSNNDTTMLVTNTGTIFSSNQLVSSNFLKQLALSYNSPQVIGIGTLHRQVLSYKPLTGYPLGIVVLSSPITESAFQDSLGFLFYLALLCAMLFLCIIILYGVFIAIPLTQITTFFANYAKGKETKLPVNKTEIFQRLSDYANRVTQKIHSDYQKIERADAIQDDFILLSGHLLRTPLTSILGYIDLLKQENKDESIKGTIQSIQNAVDKLMQLEENILSLSQESTDIINAPIERIEVKDIMKEAFDALEQSAKNKNLSYLLDASAVVHMTIQGNKKNIVHALKNYISNAIKFTVEHGTVKIYAQKKSNIVSISVSDTGIGMTKDELTELFKKFSKNSDTLEYDADGLGLGLYVTKTIVETYGGDVHVDSIKGNGSIFSMSFPLAA